MNGRAKRFRLTRSRLLEILFVLLLISYPIASELIYKRDISPDGLTHFSEFGEKFSELSSVYVFESPAGRIMRCTGRGPRPGLFALPSSAPKYYFDVAGNFLGWVPDPGDGAIPEKWEPTGEAEAISYEEARRRIAAKNSSGHDEPAIGDSSR